MAMRRGLWIVVLIALAWSAWWVAGARTKEAAIAGWFEARRAAGWAADYDSLGVAGFPLDFRTRMAGIVLADTRAQLAWTLPELGIAAAAWRPTRVQLAFPPDQILATPRGEVAIGSTALIGELALNTGPMLALRQAELTAAELQIADPDGTVDFAAPYARIARVAPDANRYAVTAGATSLHFDAEALRLIDPQGQRPATVDTLRLEMEVAFDAPLDRRTIEQARPAITGIALNELAGVWGQLELRAAGRLAVDPAGRPEGLIQVKAVNWREMVDQARAAGALPERLARPVEQALGAMAGLAGSAETLDIPLSFRGGRVWLGLLPLGRAPRIVLR
jgi:hypothetical protein